MWIRSPRFLLLMPILWAQVDVESGKTQTIQPGMNRYSFEVKRPQYYALSLHAPKGVGYELVDRRMILAEVPSQGPNNRRDFFLDPGEHQLRLNRGSKEDPVAFELNPFVSAGPPELLEPERLHQTLLTDRVYRRLLFRVDRERTLFIEAMGRELGACRLMKPNGVFVGESFVEDLHEAVKGQPMRRFSLLQRLEPGVYELHCFGAPALDWAFSAANSPLMVRVVQQFWSNVGLHEVELEADGLAHFLLPSSPEFCEFSTEQPIDAEMMISRFDLEYPAVLTSVATARLEAKKARTTAYIQSESENVPRLVTLRAAPGSRLQLRYFQPQTYIQPSESGRYFFSTVHNRNMANTGMHTGVIASQMGDNSPIEAQQMPSVSGSQNWNSRFNVESHSLFWLDFEEEGEYQLEILGDSTARVALTLTPTRRNFAATPHWVAPGFDNCYNCDLQNVLNMTDRFPVSANFFVPKSSMLLRIQAERPGILHIALRKVSSKGSRQPPTVVKGFREGLRFPELELNHEMSYGISLGHRANMRTGFILRPEWLDLSEPLAISLAPGEELEYKVRMADEPGEFRVTGRGLALVDNQPGPLAGQRVIRLKAEPNQAVVGMLWFQSRALPVSLADSPSERPLSLVKLESGKTQYLDLGATEDCMAVRVNEAGFYGFETTGRVSTALMLRTQAQPRFASGKQEKSKNALLQCYLLPGDYLLSLRALDNTKGRIGVRMRHTGVRETPHAMNLGEKSFVNVPAGSGLRVPIRIESGATYRIEALGLGKHFPYRLEDEWGWPLKIPEFSPNRSLELWLEPGSYRYYSLPFALDTWRSLELRRPEPEFSQADVPNPVLSFGVPMRGTLRRDRPITIRFPMSATAALRFRLSQGLTAAVSLGEKLLFRFEGTWNGELKRGDYLIRITCEEDNDRVPLEIFAECSQLMPGSDQILEEVEGKWEMRLVKNTITELFSEGTSDVSARIWDSRGQELTLGKERVEGDWNVSIVGVFPEGKYSIAVKRNSGDREPVKLKMRTRAIRSAELPMRPFQRRFDFTGQGWNFVLSPERDELIRLSGKGLVWQWSEEGKILSRSEEVATAVLRAGRNYELAIWTRDALGKGEVEIRGETREAVDWTPGSPLPQRAEAIRVVQPSPQALLVQQPFRDWNWISGSGLAQALPASGILPANLETWLIPGAKPLGAIEPLKLGVRQNVQLDLREGQLTLELDWTEPIPGLVRLLGEAQEFAGNLVDLSAPPLQGYHWDAQAFCEGQTLIGVPGKGRYRLKLWCTKPGPATLRVETLVFRAAPPSGMPVLERGLSLGAGEVLAVDWAPALLESSLLLGEGVGLFVWHGQDPGLHVFADGIGRETSLPQRAGRLFLYNLESTVSMVRIQPAAFESLPLMQVELAQDARFEALIERPMKIEIETSNSEVGGIWKVEGPLVAGEFLGDDGMRLTFPFDALPARSGRFRLELETGLLSVRRAGNWLDGNGLFDSVPELQTVVEPDKVISLEPHAQSWALEVARPCLLRIEFDQPGAVALFRQDQPILSQIAQTGSKLSLVVAVQPGSYRCWTRPLAGQRLPGKFIWRQLEPMALAIDGKSEMRLLAANEIQVYRFEIQHEEPFGIGIQAERGKINGRIWGANGKQIAEAPLYFGTLPAGEYLFSVENEGEPTTYRLVTRQGKMMSFPPEH